MLENLLLKSVQCFAIQAKKIKYRYETLELYK